MEFENKEASFDAPEEFSAEEEAKHSLTAKRTFILSLALIVIGLGLLAFEIIEHIVLR